MDITMMNVESMTESELQEMIRSAEKALDRLIAKRERSALKEAKRMAAEVGFEVTFTKLGKAGGGKEKPQSPRGKAVQKYRNPDHPEETWSGRGPPPYWAQAALAHGETLAYLAISTTFVASSN